MGKNADGSRRIIEEIFGAGNYELAHELIGADAIGHDPAQPAPIMGPEGVAESARGYREAFPDLTLTANQVIADGDHVAIRWTATGTHKGDLFGIAADREGDDGYRDHDRPVGRREGRRVLDELGHARPPAAARRCAGCNADGLTMLARASPILGLPSPRNLPMKSFRGRCHFSSRPRITCRAPTAGRRYRSRAMALTCATRNGSSTSASSSSARRSRCFDDDLAAWLDTPDGRFARFIAEYDR